MFSGFQKIAFALLLVGLVGCLYLAWRPSPFLSEVWWIPYDFGSWADGKFNSRTTLPFVVLGFLAGLFAGKEPKLWLYAAIGLGVFAVVLELGQLFLPRRSFTIADIAFGWLGAASGLFLAKIMICLGKSKISMFKF